MNLLPRSGPLNVFLWAGMLLTLVRHACARRQNKFEVHVLQLRELLASHVRKDNFAQPHRHKRTHACKTRIASNHTPLTRGLHLCCHRLNVTPPNLRLLHLRVLAMEGKPFRGYSIGAKGKAFPQATGITCPLWTSFAAIQRRDSRVKGSSENCLSAELVKRSNQRDGSTRRATPLNDYWKIFVGGTVTIPIGRKTKTETKSGAMRSQWSPRHTNQARRAT
jgi:hypothetical protein